MTNFQLHDLFYSGFIIFNRIDSLLVTFSPYLRLHTCTSYENKSHFSFTKIHISDKSHINNQDYQERLGLRTESISGKKKDNKARIEDGYTLHKKKGTGPRIG